MNMDSIRLINPIDQLLDIADILLLYAPHGRQIASWNIIEITCCHCAAAIGIQRLIAMKWRQLGRRVNIQEINIIVFCSVGEHEIN